MAQKTGIHIAYLDFDDILNPLLAAGQARATVEMGKRLVAMGNTVTVYCSRYPGYKDRTENGITYKHIGVGTGNIRFNNAMYILLLPFYVLGIKADVIVECFTAPILTLFSPLFTKIPVVGIPTQFGAKYYTLTYHLPFDLVEKFGARFYKYFIPYTDDIDVRFKEMNPNVISTVIPNGVGDEFFQIKQKKPKYILYLGRFDLGQKGVDLLLKAYAKVKDVIPYPLVIAGHGPDEEKIREIIKQEHLEDKVTIAGAAYGEKKMKLLSEALYVAFPSRHDDLPLFSLEAIASGLPLISFEIDGLMWTDKSFSMKAPCYDIDAYSQVLLEAATTDRIDEMRKNAREKAVRFKWDTVAAGYDKFLRYVVKTEQKHDKR